MFNVECSFLVNVCLNYLFSLNLLRNDGPLLSLATILRHYGYSMIETFQCCGLAVFDRVLNTPLKFLLSMVGSKSQKYLVVNICSFFDTASLNLFAPSKFKNIKFLFAINDRSDLNSNYSPKRSSHLQIFYKNAVLKNFAKFTGEYLCRSLFFNKVTGLQPATLSKMSL